MYITITQDQKSPHMFRWVEQKGHTSMLAFMAYTFGIYFPNMSRQIFHMQASNMSQNYL